MIEATFDDDGYLLFRGDATEDDVIVDGDDVNGEGWPAGFEEACVEGSILDADYDPDDTSTFTIFHEDANRVTNTTTMANYSTIQAAVDDADDGADEGDTLEARGDFDEGTILVGKEVTIVAAEDATVSGSFHVTADDVRISGFTISDYDMVLGERVGIYLQDVADVTIDGNTIDGEGTEGTSRGVLTAGSVTGDVTGNTVVNNVTGVSNNPGSQLVIDGNTFQANTAGVASDSADGVEIVNNDFVDNEEGVGLGAGGVLVEDNWFGEGNDDYVCVYTGTYDLTQIRNANVFEGDVYIDDNCLTSQLPEPSVVNTRTEVVYSTIQAAVDDADDGPDEGDTLEARGDFDEGTILVGKEVTIVAAEDATVSGSFRVTADNVTISGFTISDYETVDGQIAGIYLSAGVAGVEIEHNVFDGGEVDQPRGVITESGTSVTGTVSGNEFVRNTTGVFNNAGSQLVIDDNDFIGNDVGVGNDSHDGITVTGNRFEGNTVEGIGLGGENAVVTGNWFGVSNEAYICVYADGYELEVLEGANTFEGDDVVDDGDRCLVPSANGGGG
jgi:nitrous oxidase accessory protein NosD